MKIDDIVRITCGRYPDVAREGKVIFVKEYDGTDLDTTYEHVAVLDFWNEGQIYSTEHFSIEVIHGAPLPEPREYGSIHVDSTGENWIKFSNEYLNCWINRHGVIEPWEHVRGY